MPRIGLKLWSTNLDFIPVTKNLFAEKIFSYVELFTVPGTLDTIPMWRDLGIPYILHAPHSASGLNLGDRDKRSANLELAQEVDSFFSALLPEFVIFHAGVGDDLEEPVLQIKSFKSRFPDMYKKILVENKPKLGLRAERCLGSSSEEIRFIIEGTKCGLCLDFSHAICYSIAAKKNWKSTITNLLAFKPKMFHLCDGAFSAEDTHEHLGCGEFDLLYLTGLIRRNQCVTLETKKDTIKQDNRSHSSKSPVFMGLAGSEAVMRLPNNPSVGLQGFVDDVNFFKGLICRELG